MERMFYPNNRNAIAGALLAWASRTEVVFCKICAFTKFALSAAKSVSIIVDNDALMLLFLVINESATLSNLFCTAPKLARVVDICFNNSSNSLKSISDISYTSNQIVASGYISQRYAKKYLTGIGRIFVENSFWNSEIEQINVLKDGSVELVPRVGNHIVYLGEPFNIERKLKRLYDFYVYGLNKIGWNKYQYINLEFDNQIICRK